MRGPSNQRMGGYPPKARRAKAWRGPTRGNGDAHGGPHDHVRQTYGRGGGVKLGLRLPHTRA
eukprot:9576161-Alexandrium_andersonii.AAC.1